MKIAIKIPIDPESLMERNIIHWKLFAHKYYLIILVEFLGGISCLISGMRKGYTWKSTVNGASTLYTFNGELSIGIAFLLLAIISFFNIQRSRNSFFKKVRASMQNNISDNASMEIDNTEVKYRDSELIQEIKWSLFSHYKFYKNYLFLITSDNYITSILIDKRLLTSSEFAELSAYVKKQLSEKK